MIFTHSLRSDWNHGHVHFLRGVIRTLLEEGHTVSVLEQQDGWSATNLAKDHGAPALDAYATAYPALPQTLRLYHGWNPSVERVVSQADVVLVQEWNDPDLIRRLGELRQRLGTFRLYFHDAHHRSATDPDEIAALRLDRYDGVLAFGDVVRDRYRANGWAERAFTWHEAADTDVFRPQAAVPDKDLVWVGNWGDEERSEEFHRLFLGPARRLGCTGTVHGVRYPDAGRRAVHEAGLAYGGYLPNHRVPEVFARHRVAVHLPRRAYVSLLPGVPTIRVFEALACGIPLVSAVWEDREDLFRIGKDLLMVQDEMEMTETIQALCEDPELRHRLMTNGLERIRDRHTCRHRVRQLMDIDARSRGGLSPVYDQTNEATMRTNDLGRAPPAGNGDAGTRPANGGRPVIPHTASGGGNPPAQRSAPDDRADDGPTAGPGPAVRQGPRIAFFGSSLVSSYWNGAATYYRGLLCALARRGCRITFYEPDAYDRQAHRDIADPEWARVVVYPAEGTQEVDRVLEDARGADVVVKASGVGVHDAYLEKAVLRLKGPATQVVFWDVDAPATLERLAGDASDPFHRHIGEYDLVCTYGGGPPVVDAYEQAGARRCVPVYNGLDPETHHPADADPRFGADLSFLGNRLPDRERRVEHFFLRPAEARPQRRFCLGGNGWDDKDVPPNVRVTGHVPTAAHNAFNASAKLVLNIHRESMARFGWSPATRIFEAAGAGACIVTDAFEGVERFFAPGREILVAETGADVVEFVDRLDAERAVEIGRRARERALADHSYDRRAEQVMRLIGERAPEVVVE